MKFYRLVNIKLVIILQFRVAKMSTMNTNFTLSQLKYLIQFEGGTRIEMERKLRIGIVATQYHSTFIKF